MAAGLDQAAKISVGHGNAELGAVFDGTGVDAYGIVRAKVTRHTHLFANANARFESHRRAAYTITGGVGAEW